MESNKHQVVSLLVGEEDLKMITINAGVVHIKGNTDYNVSKLIEDITPKLDGSNIVDVDLNDYLIINQALKDEKYAKNGIRISHNINGKMVEGIFYPSEVGVTIQESPEVEPVAVPDIKALGKHMQRAMKEDSPAVRNFLKRLAPVIRERRHSAEDLMNFIRRCEMPLTHDGRIIGYKRVQQGKVDGEFVDCHSRSVAQRVGSRVFMDVDGVDPDRNRSCSHGLHVANLGYMKGFHGSHVLMVLVDPANFIAVPHNENTKCRVCAYDIFGVVTGSSQRVIESSSIPEDATFDSLIKDAIEGRAVKPDEIVKVGQSRMLERRPITEEELFDPMLVNLELPEDYVTSSPKSLDLDPEVEETVAQDTKEAVSQLRKSTVKLWEKAEQTVRDAFDLVIKGELSKTEICRKLNTSTRTLGRWMDKYDFKGYEESLPETIAEPETKEENAPENTYDVYITGPLTRKINLIKEVRFAKNLDLKRAKDAVETPGLVLANVPESVLESIKDDSGLTIVTHGSDVPEAALKVPEQPAPAKVSEPTGKPLGVKDQAKALFDNKDWAALFEFKKKKKKSWSSLGFSKSDEKTILKNKP